MKTNSDGRQPRTQDRWEGWWRRAQAGAGSSVAKIMQEINDYLYENTPSEKFATLFYAELDPATGVMEYSNAGHPPALLFRRSGEMLRLMRGGLPTEIMAGVNYQTGVLEFELGDRMVVYSDGGSETVSGEGEQLGEAGLIEIAWQDPDSSAASLRDCIGKALSGFDGASSPGDDRALVIVKRTVRQGSEIGEPTSSKRQFAASVV